MEGTADVCGMFERLAEVRKISGSCFHNGRKSYIRGHRGESQLIKVELGSVTPKAEMDQELMESK